MARSRRLAHRRFPWFSRAGVIGTTLLLGASALLAGAPVPPAKAAVPAATVVVRLTIDAVDIINCFDEIAGIGCGDADFYPVVHVNSGPEQVGTKINDNNHPRPDDWVFESAEIPYSAGTTVPISIGIYDSDGAFRGDDDQADISPTDGTDTLAFSVAMGGVPCSVDLPTGAPDSTCGLAAHAWGFEDDEGAEITFRVNVLNTASDADGDGLADDWEANGVTFNGQFIDLPAMGADPNKPDLFIHLDWMQDATHDQRLNSAAIQRVVNAFANSGYVSPTGSVGINLWVDQGPTSTLSYPGGTTWGTLSRAQSVPWQQNLGDGGGEFPYEWDEFQAIKDANFAPTGRSPIFHYAIAAFFQEAPSGVDEDGNPLPQNTSSGISRNSVGAGFGDGTSDFLITLGNFGTPPGSGTILQQAGTLMHEFGHNLGLRHGGDEDVNFKPNYPSVMNYFFQFAGLSVTTAGVTTGNVFDYSRGTLADVSEIGLDEAAGLGAAFNVFGTGTRCPIAGSDPPDWTSMTITRANIGFDWNCDGDDDDGTLNWDANGSGVFDGAHHDHNDWAAIKFRVGAIGDVGDGGLDLPMASPVEPIVTSDNLPPTTTASLAGTPGQNGWYLSAVTVKLSATDAGGSGVALTEYRVSGGAWTTYTAPFVVSGESTGHLVEFRSTDGAGNEEATKSVSIPIDTTGPTLACAVTPNQLWPPNHRLVPVGASVSVSDAGSGAAGYTLRSVTSSEPDNGIGDGDTAPDVQGFATGTPDTTGQLRAERAGTGTGRVYRLTYEGSDVAGNLSTCSVTVRVAST